MHVTNSVNLMCHLLFNIKTKYKINILDSIELVPFNINLPNLISMFYSKLMTYWIGAVMTME